MNTSMQSAEQRCTRCKSVVADPNETGPLCASCSDSDGAFRTGWRAWFPPAAIPGAIAAGLGFCLSLSYFVNGRGLDIVAFVAGLVAVASGGAGTVQAFREKSGMPGALAVLVVGLYHLLWRSGVLTLLF